jgi:hypothetical protein
MRKLLVLLAFGVVGAALFATTGSAARAAKGSATTSAPAGACAAQLPATMGHFGGVASAMSIAGSCAVHNTSDPANGDPPLINWGGPVMSTDSGPVVVTPIFWEPTGHSMSSAYKNIITRYLGDVAAASGSNSNVYSTLVEYPGSNGANSYDIQLGTPINDTQGLPRSGCSVMHKDRSNIYADGTGYFACLDDAQLTTEIQRVIDANDLPQNDYSHIYVLFLAKGVESCFNGGQSTSPTNPCTINHYKSAAYCAYHSMMGSNWPDYGTVYANMPYPIYQSPVGYTCGTDALSEGFGGLIQSPNGNPDADTEVSPTSHEIMESLTDPNVYNGWYDALGYENGDECAYVWGGTQGAPGAEYNQVIDGNDYMTQQEFSNLDFSNTLANTGTGFGCVQSESAVTPLNP